MVVKQNLNFTVFARQNEIKNEPQYIEVLSNVLVAVIW